MILENEYINLINKSFPSSSAQILAALNSAKNFYNGQQWQNGLPYISHVLEVSKMLIDYGLDSDTIIASLVYNAYIMGKTSLKDIKESFGEGVEGLVKGCSKASSMHYNKNENNGELENIRQMLLALGKDIRVMLIIICERYLAMLSVDCLNESESLELSKETMDIFVPLIERLGMGSIKSELEDICFKHLNPTAYNELKAELDRKYKKRKLVMEEANAAIMDILKRLNIKGEVSSRFKHFYSVYKKLDKGGMDKIYDIIALRVIVPEIKDCYSVLGEIHSVYKPVPGRIKDYIASPKPNGYQSLHTTLLSRDGVPFEVQVRTQEMHAICEYGLAAHWRYKEHNNKQNEILEKMNWFKKTLESEKGIKDNEKFIDALKTDLETGSIWVFTPKRKPIELPEKASPVDFAYAIHTNVGNTCSGAIVNGKIVPLNYELSTGDVVEIITNANSKGPSPDWLNFVKSAGVRQQIKSYFKKQSKEENIKLGKEILEQEAKKYNYKLSDLMADIDTDALIKRFNLSVLDDVFASVGFGAITPKQVIGKVISDRRAQERAKEALETAINAPLKHNHNNPSAVIVDGKTNLSVKFAQCCKPIPGDDIVGFSSIRGITIHKASCKNIETITKEKQVSVAWQNAQNLKFYVPICFIAQNSAPVLSQLTPLLAKMKVNIVSINSKLISSGESQIDLVIEAKDREEVNNIKSKIKTLKGVDEVI